MAPRRIALLLVALLLAGAALEARPRQHRRSAGLSARRRAFTSPLTADPGSVDLELSGVFDWNSAYGLPATLKYTPSGWRTELSFGADTAASVVDDAGDRDTHFSDHLNLAASTAFRVGEHFTWAVAPAASFFLRGESGARLGGALFGRFDRGADTFTGFANWSGATTASPSNPAGTFDLNAGYARQFRKRWTAYTNAQWERATGAAGFYSVFEGVEFHLSDRLALDLSASHYSLGRAPDHQVAAGLTWTLYRR